jgi:ribose transport system ATP-binding protein
VGPEISDPQHSRLRAEGLSKTFGSARVLKDADLEIGAGEIHALIGANGSGKSTLIKCITGVERPDRGGRLEVDGQEIGHE